MSATAVARHTTAISGLEPELDLLNAVQERALWLAVYMVHHANYVRPNADGGKIGGHQASSASMVGLLTSLTFDFLRADDRLAVKPHASPVFHALQYLLGRLPEASLTTLRAYQGLQAYPSRTKDPDEVDFSTGSVGLGAAAPLFAALVHRYLADHLGRQPQRRFVALVGDAELDEGNVWEALLDPALAGLENVLWIVDLNRQSLDRVVPGRRGEQLARLFAACGWRVLEARYGRRLQALLDRPGGDRLRERLESASNETWQTWLRLPGQDLRRQLTAGAGSRPLGALLSAIDDRDLPVLIQDLGGHDLACLRATFQAVGAGPFPPTVILAHTIKGWRLPLAAHPLNHAQLLTQTQIEQLGRELGIDPRAPWAAFPPDSPAGALCRTAASRLYPDRQRPVRRLSQARRLAPADIPAELPVATSQPASTQQTFGRLLLGLSRQPSLYERLVTLAPDVAVSTNLSGWIAKAGVYRPAPPDRVADDQAPIPSDTWTSGPDGQHIELGIAEMNLFLGLGMFGLAHELLGQQLIPIGTVYDPFVCRGLDALIYALYSGARFILAGTPSGITLAPEGGAHQSTVTVSLGIELPGLNYFEPCYAGELAWLMAEALRDCCQPETGRASYLRLSTRVIDQAPFLAAQSRLGAERLRQQVLAGGYRLRDWRDGRPAGPEAYLVHIAASGAMVPEALAAAHELATEGVPVNVLNLTSPRRLYEAWIGVTSGPAGSASAPFDWLIPPEESHAPIVTVIDGASHALAWLGSVAGTPVVPLGVDQFGQSGSRADLYRHYGVDVAAIVDAALVALDRRGLP